MNISFDRNAWNEYKYWEFQDNKHLRKINRLIDDIVRNGPQQGIGKPEPLKFLVLISGLEELIKVIVWFIYMILKISLLNHVIIINNRDESNVSFSRPTF
ncbi:MAG: Hypothetical protein AJITA_00821 [Acetilactobacillus jinshanensis]